MASPLHVTVADDAQQAANLAAAAIVDALGDSISKQGTASVAFSGGSTPVLMFDALATAHLDWAAISIFQVDERIAPDGSPDRNVTQLRDHLLSRIAIPDSNVHMIDVNTFGPDDAAAAYASTLKTAHCTHLDVVHLGLGDDGHTASLVPADPVLTVHDRLVAATQTYKGYRRVTLTYPALHAAKRLIWLAPGAAKGPMIARLQRHDPTIPAGAVAASGTNIAFTDLAAIARRP